MTTAADEVADPLGEVEPGRPVPISERAERSGAVQGLISVVIIVLLAAQIATHLPGSALRSAVREPALRVQRIAGTEMSWGVFAPDPRRTSLRLEARVDFADGSTAMWELPQGGVLGPNLRYYRWRKWLERARSRNFRSLWAPTAEWIASLHDDRAAPVESVTLIVWFRDNTLRGPQPEYQRNEYFTLDIDGGGSA